MKKSVLLMPAFVMITIFGQAQCNDFIIYQAKGEVNLLQGNTTQPARKNLKLTSDCSLSLGAEAAVILLSGKDKALRLTKPGTLTMTEIRATCMKNQSSLTKEYLNYVAQSILEKSEPKTAMVIKGAVYRTRTELEPTPMIEPADSSVTSDDPVTFAWHLGTPGIPRYLLIYENGVNVVYSKMLSDTTQTIEANLFKPDVIYFWLVSTSDTPSDKEPRFTFIAGESDWQTKFLDEQWEETMNELEGELEGLQGKIKKK